MSPYVWLACRNFTSTSANISKTSPQQHVMFFVFLVKKVRLHKCASY